MFDFLLGLTNTELAVYTAGICVFYVSLLIFFLFKVKSVSLGLSGSLGLFIVMVSTVAAQSFAVNDYLVSKTANFSIHGDFLYKVDKKETIISPEVKMTKTEETFIGNLRCGNLVLRDCLDLLVKHQELISAQGSEGGSIDVASFK